MRVVHVHRMRGVGGSERHLLTLLPALREHGIEPVFVGLDDPAWDSEPFYRDIGVEAVRLKEWRGLRRALRGLRPDVVHTHLVHADVYGALATPHGVPVVSTKHNDDRFRLGPYRFVERAITRRASRVICITHALKQFNAERVGLPEERLEVVHYGLDEPPRAWGENTPLELPESARVLLCVARLVPQKGVDVAVRALARVRERHPDAVLVVLGDGPLRGSLAGDGVYIPRQRMGDIAEWYGRAELVVHPARWEGFGLALLEAMLCERAVVATRVSAAPEIVADGETGLLVSPDDPVALAGAVSTLLDDRERAAEMGRAGYERARREFSVARMAEQTAAVYRGV